MATGILSLDLHIHRTYPLSAALLWLAVAAYVSLVVLTVWRIVAFAPEVRRDLRRPGRGFGYFTFVAGTNILGTATHALYQVDHLPITSPVAAAGTWIAAAAWAAAFLAMLGSLAGSVGSRRPRRRQARRGRANG